MFKFIVNLHWPSSKLTWRPCHFSGLEDSWNHKKLVIFGVQLLIYQSHQCHHLRLGTYLSLMACNKGMATCGKPALAPKACSPPGQAHGGVGAAICAVEDTGIVPWKADHDGTTTFDGNQLPESCQTVFLLAKNRWINDFKGIVWKPLVFIPKYDFKYGGVLQMFPGTKVQIFIPELKNMNVACCLEVIPKWHWKYSKAHIWNNHKQPTSFQCPRKLLVSIAPSYSRSATKWPKVRHLQIVNSNVGSALHFSSIRATLPRIPLTWHGKKRTVCHWKIAI